MLCQFTFKNFASFKNETTLNLQATNITEHENEIIIDSNDDQKFLPLAVIYGPNGGGKTNVISALYALCNKIMRPICAACDKKECPQQLKKKVNISPFKFDTISAEQPTEFEIFFRIKQTEYRYNLALKGEVVIAESLYAKKTNSNSITKVFVRNDSEKNNIILNKSIFKQVTVSGITETLPLLSYFGITQKGTSVIKDVISWLQYDMEIINYGDPIAESSIFLSKSEETKQLILQILREMDIDIVDYRIDDKDADNIKVYTKHCIDDIEKELSLFDESNGTIKLFGLVPYIIDSIKSGSPLIIDELDAKIHPKLLEYIIELYRNPTKNKKGAQLIFTSHDLMTMTGELFRRDEIWFAAKNNEQASQLYSLVEFKKDNGKQPRKDEKYGKQYLEGRYGADPYLKRMINWEDQNEVKKCQNNRMEEAATD